MQAGAAHDAVHQEGGARHVAEVFQQQDEQEQDQDLRQEHEHAADAGDHAVDDEALQQAGRQVLLRQHAERAEAGRDQVHQRLRPGEHRLEHHEQDAEQDRQPGDRMQQHGVEPRGQRVGLGRHAHGEPDDAVGLALGGAQFAAASAAPNCSRHAAAPPAGHQFVETAQQIVGAAAAHRGRGGHRHAELARQPLEIDLDAAPARDVDHVEHQQQRPADPLQLDHQPQRQPQIGGVGDAEQQVGLLLAREAAEHDVAGDFLVGAARAQRIGAGQIDQADAVAARRLHRAGLALDGDARIVGDLLAAAGQCVEQRGLAAVRRADQREMVRSCRSRNAHGGPVRPPGWPWPRGGAARRWRR